VVGVDTATVLFVEVSNAAAFLAVVSPAAVFLADVPSMDFSFFAESSETSVCWPGEVIITMLFTLLLPAL
jgi:hypothetical protein